EVDAPAEGVAHVAAGGCRHRGDDGDDGSGRINALDGLWGDGKPDRGPTDRAARRDVGVLPQRHRIHEGVEGAPGVEIPPVDPEPVWRRGKGEAICDDVALVVEYGVGHAGEQGIHLAGRYAERGGQALTGARTSLSQGPHEMQ